MSISNFKQPRITCEAHLKWVRTLPCSVPDCRTGARIEVHHLLQGGEPKGRGLRASDSKVIPLCKLHHDPCESGSVHHHGNERVWCEARNIDARQLAADLWAESQKAGRA